MSYSTFNRHLNMDAETLKEIGKIITEVDFDNFELNNQLYGLYDGYLYDELLVNAQDLPKDLFRRIIKVWAIVSKYPKIHYYSDYSTTEVEHDPIMEYRKGMGVAEGKEYLASC